METKKKIPEEQAAVDPATVAQARAVQIDAGTPSAVEYLKARDVEGSVIEQVLAEDLPEPSRVPNN